MKAIEFVLDVIFAACLMLVALIYFFLYLVALCGAKL